MATIDVDTIPAEEWPPWTTALVAAVERGVPPKRACQIANARTVWRRYRPWSRRQHLRYPPRACRAFSLLLWRIRSGLTTERDVGRVQATAWRLEKATELVERLWARTQMLERALDAQCNVKETDDE